MNDTYKHHVIARSVWPIADKKKKTLSVSGKQSTLTQHFPHHRYHIPQIRLQKYFHLDSQSIAYTCCQQQLIIFPCLRQQKCSLYDVSQSARYTNKEILAPLLADIFAFFLVHFTKKFDMRIFLLKMQRGPCCAQGNANTKMYPIALSLLCNTAIQIVM